MHAHASIERNALYYHAVCAHRSSRRRTKIEHPAVILHLTLEQLD